MRPFQRVSEIDDSVLLHRGGVPERVDSETKLRLMAPSSGCYVQYRSNTPTYRSVASNVVKHLTTFSI